VIGGKKCIAAIVLAVFLLSAIPISVTDGSEAASEDFIKFYEVYPVTKYEGVSLFNYGSSAVNLKGYEITDGEGTLTINSDLTLAPSARITFAADISADDWFSGRSNVYSITDKNVITQSGKTYTLADTGDDLYLYKDGKLLDAVSYGDKVPTSGWTGVSLSKVTATSGKYLLRIGVVDTDSAEDWIVTSRGLTNHQFDPTLIFDAKVTPFVFPDSKGEQIYRTFENAKSEILISIYQLTNVNLVALLCQLESRTGSDHVDVTITLEGAVLGADLSTELTLMKSIVDAGGEVWLINDSKSGNYERFSYFHNKYAVIDDKKVIITSENWTQGNLSSGTGNRGWGAVIESTEYAAYMKSVFYNDHDKQYGDVFDLVEYYPDVNSYAKDLTYKAPAEQSVQTFNAKVTPVLSPDNSHDALKYYMDSANTWIYSEQLDLGTTYTITNPESPVYWMSSAANRGVDARFILDASIVGDEHIKEVALINSTSNLKATTIKKGAGFGTTHNKGIIFDDKVWVGSVNWTSNSFLNNRETAVVIDSPEVTSFFMDYFMIDWKNNTVAETDLTVTSYINADIGVAIFKVDGGTSDTEYEWDVLGNGNWVTSGTSTIVRKDLPSGDHTLGVRTVDGKYSAELSYNVASGDGTPTTPPGDKEDGKEGDGTPTTPPGDEDKEEKSSEDSPLDIGTTEIGIIAAIIIIIGAAIGGLKVSKGRKGR
jgi:phosphatidylserine/phosphatidylglycerophosphate/cardiolipin synthase-like enzyme